MSLDQLKQRAYALCLQCNRMEIIADIPPMDITQVSGLISYLLRLQGC